jgi:sporulation-control protein spo0M
LTTGVADRFNADLEFVLTVDRQDVGTEGWLAPLAEPADHHASRSLPGVADPSDDTIDFFVSET